MKPWNSKIHPGANDFNGYCEYGGGVSRGNGTTRGLELTNFELTSSKHPQDQNVAFSYGNAVGVPCLLCGCLVNSSTVAGSGGAAANFQDSEAKLVTDLIASPKFHLDPNPTEYPGNGVLVRAHWIGLDAGSRELSTSSLQLCGNLIPDPAFEASRHTFSGQVLPHEGFQHSYEKNELPGAFAKVIVDSEELKLSTPACPECHLVTTKLPQNSLDSFDIPTPCSEMQTVYQPAPSYKHTSQIKSAPFKQRINPFGKLAALRAEYAQSLNSLCTSWQGTACCRHYYAIAVIFWLTFIVSTVLVLTTSIVLR